MDLGPIRQAARFMNAGLMLAASVFLCAAGGYLLDDALEVQNHWFFLAGVVVGFGAGMYNLVRELSRTENKDSGGRGGTPKPPGSPEDKPEK